jgi:hypothetical protein
MGQGLFEKGPVAGIAGYLQGLECTRTVEEERLALHLAFTIAGIRHGSVASDLCGFRLGLLIVDELAFPSSRHTAIVGRPMSDGRPFAARRTASHHPSVR